MSIQPKIAFLYPGQGAVPEQPPADRFAGHPRIAAIYNDLAVSPCPGYDHFYLGGDMSDLKAQLGVYGLSYALGQVLRRQGIEPDVVTGYSSGVYAALAAAGGFASDLGPGTIEHAFDSMLACRFAEPYAMVAVIGLDMATVDRLLRDTQPTGWLSLANNRSQLIVSIPAGAFEEFSTACHENGALKVVRLPFERPYHVPPLSPAADTLYDFLRRLPLLSPAIPMVAGSEPRVFQGSTKPLCRAVADQLWQPVNWHPTIEKLLGLDVDLLVCLDPTETLGRIVRWITRKVEVWSITNSRDIDALAAVVAQRGTVSRQSGHG